MEFAERSNRPAGAPTPRRGILWYLAVAIVVGAGLLGPPRLLAAQLVDRIVAVVNDDVITATELERDLQRSLQQLRQRMGPGNLPPRKVLRRQLLERMIIDRIQTQRARERGLQVSAQEVDQAVRRMARQNGLSVSRFREALQRQGLDYGEYRQRLKEQILRGRLQDRAVRSKVHVTDEEVASYLARQGKGSQTDFEYHLRHILVAVPEEASPQETEKLRAKAEGLRERIRQGDAFSRVAASESDGQNALDGGELGWFRPGELPAPVLAEIEAVNPGHLSRVVRTPSGFHLFKVTDRRKMAAATETQVRARHILLRTDTGRGAGEARALARELLRRIRGDADFAALARQFSEGPSARQGGDLGWISRGQMVSTFEELIFSLEPGELGGPVTTQFGVHIAEVTGKREKAVNPEDERKAARQALRTRKTRERMDQWLRELRAQSFVEIRLGDQSG